METLDVILSAEELIGGFSAGGMISSDINFKIVLHCVERDRRKGQDLGARGGCLFGGRCTLPPSLAQPPGQGPPVTPVQVPIQTGHGGPALPGVLVPSSPCCHESWSPGQPCSQLDRQCSCPHSWAHCRPSLLCMHHSPQFLKPWETLCPPKCSRSSGFSPGLSLAL